MSGRSFAALRWFDPAPSQTVPAMIFQSRWPLLMLIGGLAMLTPRARWAVPAAWAYVIAIAATAFAQFVLIGNALLGALSQDQFPLDIRIECASEFLSFLLNQAMNLLPAVLLLLSAKALRRSEMAREETPVAAAADQSSPIVLATPVLSYGHDRQPGDLTWWALRLAFAVACLACLRLLGELTPLVLSRFTRIRAMSGTLPLALYTGRSWEMLDALSEYALRLACVLMLIGLWPTRRLVWSRPCVVLGAVAIGLWAVLETTAVAICGEPTFIVAGHPAVNVVSCVRIALTELAIPAMILALLRSPLP
jgi:hypothetical protein